VEGTQGVFISRRSSPMTPPFSVNDRSYSL